MKATSCPSRTFASSVSCSSSAHPSGLPRRRIVAPSAATAGLIDRPAVSKTWRPDEPPALPTFTAAVVSWSTVTKEDEKDGSMKQYSAATSLVDNLKELTDELELSLQELDFFCAALEAEPLVEAPPASTSKASSEPADPALALLASASPKAAAATVKRRTQRTARKDAAASAPAPGGASGAPVAAQSQHSDGSGTAAASRQSQASEASDMEQLEKAWGLPEGQEAEESAASQQQQGQEGSSSSRGTPPTSAQAAAFDDEDLLLQSASLSLTAVGPRVVREALPAQPSILTRSGRARRTPLAAVDTTTTGEAVVSEWGRTRQSLRAQNHGWAALEAASVEAAVKPTAAAVALRQAGRGKSSDTMHAFLKSTGGRALLTAAEEQSTMASVEDWRFLQGAASQLRAALKRSPTKHEWAMTVMTDHDSLMARLGAGEEARAKMVSANYRLVISVAKKFIRPGRDLPDLVAVGVTGLTKAVDKFEVSKGFRFATYATWWIRQAVMRSMTDQGRTLRLPAHIVAQVQKLRTLQFTLGLELARSPTPAELGAAMGLTEEKVLHLMGAQSETGSLDTPVPGNDGGDTFKDTIEDSRCNAVDHLESESLSSDLISMLDTHLDERERTVMRMRYGLDHNGVVQSLDACGRIYGITRERVRQIESRAMWKLREATANGESLAADYAGARGNLELAARNSRGTKKT